MPWYCELGLLFLTISLISILVVRYWMEIAPNEEDLWE